MPDRKNQDNNKHVDLSEDTDTNKKEEYNVITMKKDLEKIDSGELEEGKTKNKDISSPPPSSGEDKTKQDDIEDSEEVEGIEEDLPSKPTDPEKDLSKSENNLQKENKMPQDSKKPQGPNQDLPEADTPSSQPQKSSQPQSDLSEAKSEIENLNEDEDFEAKKDDRTVDLSQEDETPKEKPGGGSKDNAGMNAEKLSQQIEEELGGSESSPSEKNNIKENQSIESKPAQSADAGGGGSKGSEPFSPSAEYDDGGDDNSSSFIVNFAIGFISILVLVLVAGAAYYVFFAGSGAPQPGTSNGNGGVACEDVGPVSQFTFNPQEEIVVGEEVVFESTAQDPEQDIISYQWDFGDGTDSTEQQPTHIFETPGEYEVSLQVSDSKQCRDSAQKTISVAEAGPSVTQPSSALFNVNAEFSHQLNQTIDNVDRSQFLSQLKTVVNGTSGQAQDGGFYRLILRKNDGSIISLPEMMQVLGGPNMSMSCPEDIQAPQCDQNKQIWSALKPYDYTLFYYLEGDRIIFGAAAKAKQGFSPILEASLSSLEPDLSAFYLDLYNSYTNEFPPSSATDEFQDNMRKGYSIRYKNFSDPALALDYALSEDGRTLLFSGSRRSMYDLIDRAHQASGSSSASFEFDNSSETTSTSTQ